MTINAEDLPRVSFSRLQSWDRCHFQHNLQWNLRFKPIATPEYFYYGRLIHQCLAIWYQSLSWDLIPKYLAEQFGAVPPEVIEVVTKLIDRYCHDFAPFQDQGFKVRSVEQKIEVKLITPKGRPFILVGELDLIVEDFRQRLILYEHKSVSGGRFWSKRKAQSEIQTAIYQILLRQFGYEIWKVYINQLNRHNYKDYWNTGIEKLFQRTDTYRTELELENILAYFYDQVENLLENIDNQRRSLREDCEFCTFYDPCHYQLKGYSVADSLAVGFEQHEHKLELDK